MRFIQVGVGGFGWRWLEVLTKSKRARLVGLVDVSPAALEAACSRWGYSSDQCFRSLPKALRAVEADALVSATPPKRHRADVVAAMKAGLDAISEKPMSDSYSACRAMLETAKETGRTYAVSQNYRYRPEMYALSKLVRSGKLGRVGQVKMDFFMGVDFGGGFRHSMAYPLIVDMSIHHFDLMRFITGLDAERVRATSWNPPWSNYEGDCSSSVLFEMTGGARMLYNGSWCAKGQFADWSGNWQIECEKGTVTYEHGRITVHRAPDLYRVKKVAPVKPKAMAREGQEFVLHDFMQAVRKGERPRTDVYDNIRSVAMVFATVKAMKTGRTVPVLDAATRRLIDDV